MNKNKPNHTEPNANPNKYREFDLYFGSGNLPNLHRTKGELMSEPKDLPEYTPVFYRVVNPENARKVGGFMSKVLIKLLEGLGFLAVAIFMFLFGTILAIVDAVVHSRKDMPKWEDEPSGKTSRADIEVNVNVKVKR